MESNRADQLLNALTALLCVWLLVASLISLAFGPVDRNAGFYIPMSQLVREGHIPSVEFWNPYTPGGFYIFALMGDAGLRSPLACKIVTHLMLLAFGATLYATLRELGHRTSLAAFLASAFSVWIYSMGNWALLSIDVLEAFLVLASFLCLVKRPTRGGAALGGLVAGCALMVKQYAVLFLPFLALMALLGRVDSEPTSRKEPLDWLRTAIFLACVGIPFLAFVAVAGGHPIDLAIYFATWGGQASSHGWGHGLEAIVKNLTMNSATTLVTMAAIMAMVLVVWRRRWFHILLLALYLAGAAPLFVREFAAYATHAAAWVFIIFATFAAELAVFFHDRKWGTTVLALMACLPLVQYAASGTIVQARTAVTNPAARQRALVQALEEALPTRENVLLIQKWWLYPLADLRPPLLDYNQLNTNNLAEMKPARDAAEYIVYGVEEDAPLSQEQVENWIAESGKFEEHAVIKAGGATMILYERKHEASPAAGEVTTPVPVTAEPAVAN